MTTLVGDKEPMVETENNEKKILPHEYGCQILLEKTTLEKAKDSLFPNDVYLIWYEHEGNEYIDLTRGSKKVNIFDMYYDKYGPGSIKKIDFGYGKISPKVWGYKKTEKKKKR